MRVYEQRYQTLRRLVDGHLRTLVTQGQPKELTDGCRYVLWAGGKRVRSTLLLLSCEAVGGNVRKALNASAAIELMHNFTLVHDDIMDNAASRRGRATVHTRWNVNNAILVGDVLLGLAYKQVLRTSSAKLQSILQIFTQGFADVCEGQALDLEFEHRSDVTLNDYFEMIEKKTGRLISTSTELGALVGGGTAKQVQALRTFGRHLGRAFQLQDDLLDVVAEEKEFGKRIGGDIIEGKKTFLLLKSLENAKGKDHAALMNVMNRRSATSRLKSKDREMEIRNVASIYLSTGAIDSARKQIQKDTSKARAALRSLPASTGRETLLWFSEMLLSRNS